MAHKTIIAFTFLLLSHLTCGQQKEEYKIHLLSIDSTYYPGYIIDRVDTSFNANRAFVDYAIKNFLEEQSDIQYISNRSFLPKLEQTTCDSVSTIIKGSLPTGETVEIFIHTGQFDSTKHKIERYVEEEYGDAITKIDGQYPYGSEYSIPDNEIQTFSVNVNGNQLVIPKKFYQHLFEPNICGDWDFQRKIEAYSSVDGQFIYIYVYGGNAASTYFAKLIFDKEKYLTKIVADYWALSIHSSFRDSFIGY